MKYSRSFSKDFPPIFRNVEVWLVQKFQINFSIFTHFMRNFGRMSHNVVVAWRSSEKKVRDLKFILNIGNFFWGAKFLQTTCWTQSAVVEIWSSDHHVGTQYGKGARAQRSCSVATFQKRIASQRSAASRQLRSSELIIFC